jgi:periplasmic protein TonB
VGPGSDLGQRFLTVLHGLYAVLEKEMKMPGSNAVALPQATRKSNEQTERAALSPVRATARGHHLFADAILDENVRDRGKRAAKAGLAFTIQATIVGALLLIPLLFTEGIDLHKLDNTVLLAPPPPAPPPPPAIRVERIPKQSLLRATLTAPTVIPKKVVESAPDAGESAPVVSEGVPGGVGDALGGSVTGAAPPPPPAPKPKEPVRIFSGMKEPTLLYAPPLVYPPVARLAHVAGTVVIQAVIDDKGNVTQVKAVSGPPLLLEAALKAVSERRYQPTILDGMPVSVRFDVKVQFNLS